MFQVIRRFANGCRYRSAAAAAATLAATLLVPSVTSAQAQYRPGSQFDGCIRQFYDAQTYNWLSFQNTCGVPLHVHFIAKNPGVGVSSMDLAPGAKNSTGQSQSEVNAHNGFALAICDSGFLAVDASGLGWTHASAPYRCRSQ